MSHLLLYMPVHIIPMGTLSELILSEEALGDIQLSDLQARADLVEELTKSPFCMVVVLKSWDWVRTNPVA